MMLEWCCGDNSFFGMLSEASRGCQVVRLTIREDMSTEAGLRFAKQSVELSDEDTVMTIWSAIPCTGGSTWQNINVRLPGGKERLEKHVVLFRTPWQTL